ncbi:spore germination protein [Bacillus infantis]|uniref:spore germination protein n=1 Tax=Bacillus TaxID=1386 RepID=UPI001CD779E7|nr:MULTISPECIES: spore germination protein [Bacillus]MCA1038290.1 spore germination protein [Bacillus infantis]MCR6611090.1 spore germination protein [Bacillus infantis]MDT0163272.1 spore germination protein [Bacillus sp. AG4(2022)]
MPYAINIFNIKTNGVTQNGNLDIGPTVHNSHTANSKMVGVCFTLGDISCANSLGVSNYIDPDVSDQDQIANPSAPISNQL